MLFTFSGTSLRWNKTGGAVAGIGRSGAGANPFLSTRGIFVGSGRTVYVVDMSNSRVQRWLLNATKGSTVTSITGVCVIANLSTLCRPQSIYVDENETLYMGDSRGILMWRAEETSGILLNGSSIESVWYDIDMDADLHATTSGYAHAVAMWSSFTDPPTIVAGGGGSGYASSQLSIPYGLYIASSGKSMYTANSG